MVEAGGRIVGDVRRHPVGTRWRIASLPCRGQDRASRTIRCWPGCTWEPGGCCRPPADRQDQGLLVTSDCARPVGSADISPRDRPPADGLQAPPGERERAIPRWRTRSRGRGPSRCLIPNTKTDHSRGALVARLIAATDADQAGDRNDVLRRTRDRLPEHADAMMRLTGPDRVP